MKHRDVNRAQSNFVFTDFDLVLEVWRDNICFEILSRKVQPEETKNNIYRLFEPTHVSEEAKQFIRRADRNLFAAIHAQFKRE
jgi:hypothetical protein